MNEFLVGSLTLGSLVIAAIVVLRAARLARARAGRLGFAIAFPRGVEPAAVVGFVSSLTGLLPPRWERRLVTPAVVFETHATESSVKFRMHVERSAADFVVGQLRRAIPGARVETIDKDTFGPTLAAELRLASGHRQLRVASPADISAALLASMRPLGRGEEMLLQWVVSPLAAACGTSRPSEPSPTERSVKEKADGPQFAVAGRVGVRAYGVDRSRHLARRLLAPFHILNNGPTMFRHRSVPSELVAKRIRLAATPMLEFPAKLNARELAAVLAWPVGDAVVAGVDLGAARQLPPSPKLPRSGPAFAISNHGDSVQPIVYGLESLPYSAWIVGPTGSGKSNLLARLVSEYARMGATIVVVDSKRDLVRDIINLVPEHRVDDLVVLDPADDRPVGLNLLGSPDEAERRTDQLVGIFSKLWPGFFGPRSADILRASLLTLMKTPGHTLLEVPLLLTNDSFRRRLVAALDDPVVVQPQWAAYEAASPADRAQQIAPLLNKIRALIARRPVRDIIGQPDGLNIPEVLSSGRILLIPLSKGLIGTDAAEMLGSVLLTDVWNALTARVGLASTERRPVLIVADEFQDYVALPLSFGDMLAQGRGLGVGVVAAHQHLGQLPTSLRTDLRANARTKIAFRLGPADARVFAEEFSPYLSADDLQGLGKYEVAAQVCVAGDVLPPVTGVTLPPPEPTGFGEQARRLSRERYGRPRADVDAEIRRRHGEHSGSGSVGRRRRS